MKRVVYKIYIIEDKEVIIPSHDSYRDSQYEGEYVKILKEYISENGTHESYISMERALEETQSINKGLSFF